jgi:Flp pilus assembly protein TadB
MRIPHIKASAMAFQPVDRDVIPMLNHSTHGFELLAQLNAEESVNRLPLLLVLSILSFIGIIANAHVLFVYGTKFKRSTYRVFVLALGCIDMLGCSISIPFQIIDETHPYTFDAPIACKVFRFFDTNLAIAAAMMLVVIASERFRKICRPNGNQVTEKRAVRSIIAVIIGSSIATSPALLIYGKHTVIIESKNINGSECSWSDEASDSYYGYVYYALELLIVVLCMISLTVLYSFVGKALRAHNHRMKSTKLVKFYVRKSKKISTKVQESSDSKPDLESDARVSIESKHTDLDSGVDSPVPVSSDSNEESGDIETESNDPNKGIDLTDKETESVLTNKDNDDDEDKNNYNELSSTCHLCEDDDSPQKLSSIRRIYRKVVSVPVTLKGLLLNRRGVSEGTSAVPDIVVTDCINNTTQIIFKGHGSNKTSRERKDKSIQRNADELSPCTEQKDEQSTVSSHKKTKKPRKTLKKWFGKKKKTKDTENLRERRITKLLFFITLTFIVTYYPYIIVLVIYSIRPEFKENLSDAGRVFYLMGIRLYLINNVMNAFFYGFFDLEFRNHCKDIYKKLFRKITMSSSKTFVCKKCEQKQKHFT